MSILDKIQALDTVIADKRSAIDAIIAAAETDGETRGLTTEELDSVEDLTGEVERSAAEREKLVKIHNTIAGADKLAPMNVPSQPIHTEPRTAPEAVQFASVGQRFVESEEMRAYKGAGRSGTVLVDGLMPSDFALGRQTRATLMESAQGAVWPDVIAASGVVSAPISDKPRPLLEVISRAPTSLAAVPVLRIAADEAGAATVAEGALKPEVTWTETYETISIPTIAGWKKASRQIIEDVSLMRNLIDTKLTRAVLNEVESQVTDAVTDAVVAGTTSSGADLLSAIRVALGEVEGRGYTPNAVMLNPADYSALDLSVLGNTLLGPVVGSSFWGLRVVSNPNLDAGTAYVADFAEAVTLYERAGMSVFVTDSDISNETTTTTSDFRRNILTFLAEIRAVPVVLDASAIEAATVES